MGLLSFLSTLANGAMAPGQQDDEDLQGSNAKYGYDRDGYLMPRQQQPNPMAPPAPHSADEILVKGDAWKPKKDTVLGAIADAISYYTDGTTPFKDERDKKNMESASKGLMEHPDEAIARIAQIDPAAAWKYRGQVVDDKRMQAGLDRQNSLLDFQKQKYVYGQLANMMGVATKRNDPATWQAMRAQALNYANTYGIDASGIIPEDYSPDAIETIALGSVPVAKQMQTAEQIRNHDLQHGDRQEGHSIGRERNQIMREQGGARIGIAQENADTAGQNADTSSERLDFQKGQKQGKGVQTKYGPAMISDDGQSLTLYPHSGTAPEGYDGKGIHYIRVNNKWVPANTRTK